MSVAVGIAHPSMVLGSALLVSSCAAPSDGPPAFPAGPVVDLSGLSRTRPAQALATLKPAPAA